MIRPAASFGEVSVEWPQDLELSDLEMLEWWREIVVDTAARGVTRICGKDEKGRGSVYLAGGVARISWPLAMSPDAFDDLVLFLEFLSALWRREVKRNDERRDPRPKVEAAAPEAGEGEG